MIPKEVVESACRDRFGTKPVVFARAPGRVNLMGGHVDYNDGFVLPVAIDRAVSLAAAPLSQSVVQIFAVDLDETVGFRLEDLASRTDLSGRPLPAWALYPAGVAWSLQMEGFNPGGMQVAFASDVPIGAGLSSSAAVELAFGAAWRALGGWEVQPMALARLCQRAENQYVGVACGLMDQFASAHGVAGHALYFDTRNLDWEPLPLPAGARIVVADSGIRRSLSDSAYNERRAESEQVVALLQGYLPGVRALRDVSRDQLAAVAHHLPDLLHRRARYVVEEIERVQRAAAILRAGGDAFAFGQLMLEAHHSVRQLYETSIPEVDALVERAAGLTGCYGARLTGAGWGGCTVNLVASEAVDEFVTALRNGYRSDTGRSAEIYVCRASDGAIAEQFPGLNAVAAQ